MSIISFRNTLEGVSVLQAVLIKTFSQERHLARAVTAHSLEQTYTCTCTLSEQMVLIALALWACERCRSQIGGGWNKDGEMNRGGCCSPGGKSRSALWGERHRDLIPSSLPPLLQVPLTHSFLFFYLLKTFPRFCHPHAWLQATDEVKWKEGEAVDFKHTFLQGWGGVALQAEGVCGAGKQPLRRREGICKM